MKRIKLPKALVLLLSLAATCLLSAKDPNIIMIMTDDQGWGDAGFNGATELKTPHLDRLAAEGVILDRFYSASAVCSPTRASVVTGRNPVRNGVPGANSGHLREEEITLAELLRERGYATGHFGKWHLGTLTRKIKDANRGGVEKHFEHFTIPTSHGYDEFFCTESKVPTYDPLIKPEAYEGIESLKYGWRAVEGEQATKDYGTYYWVGEEERATENLEGDDSRVIMDRVIPFVERSVEAKKPFFTTVWFHTPHLPVVASAEQREQYSKLSLEEQIYFGTISAMDEQVGRLWESLEAQGVADNTMLWFCSDNGPENQTPGSPGIFRERKRSLYEGGVRVPAFVVWKKGLKGGRRLDFPGVTSDYLPTTLDVLNIDYPDTRPVDGESLLPMLKGKQKKRKGAIGFVYGGKTSWVDNRYKLISTNKGKTFELYDLLKDKVEENDIIEANPELASRMKRDLDAWLESIDRSKNGSDY